MECPSLPAASRDLAVVLPGGARINVMLPTSGPPTSLQLATQLTAQCSAALAPLAPVMSLVEAMMAVVDFAKSVPLILVNPPDVVEAIGKLVDSAAKVAQLVPQLSLPSMVLSMVRLAAELLDGLAEQLAALATQRARIEAAQQTMEELSVLAMQDAIDCAESLYASQLSDFQEAAASVSAFVVVVQSFGSMVGMDVPDVGDIDVDDASEAAAQLSAAARTLKAVSR